MTFKRKNRDLKRLRSKGLLLSEEDRLYIVETLARLKAGFETDEEKEIFVTNVLEQVSGREQEMACNNLGSQCLEGLLNSASSISQVEQVAQTVIKRLRLLCADPYGSHVVETLTRVLAKNVAVPGLLKNEEQLDIDLSEYCDKIVCFALNNAEDFMADPKGSHVMRTALESATGVQLVVSTLQNKRILQSSTEHSQPVGFISEKIKVCVLSLARQLLTNPDLPDLAESEATSTVVQTLLLVLGKVDNDRCQELCKALIDKMFVSPDNSMYFLDDVCATRLLESILQVGSNDVLTPVWDQIFHNRILELARHPMGKFTLQQFMDHCQSKERFEELAEELCSDLRCLIKIAHTGVLISCAKACKRLGAKQTLFINSMMDALKCREPKERQVSVAPLIFGLMKFKQYDATSTTLQWTTHGSVILQEILHFNKPTKVVESLLSLSDAQLQFLSTDRRGRYVLDAFFTGKYIGEKSRFKLIERLKGYISQMAITASGSRCLDTMWDRGTIKHRTVIAAGLAADKDQVSQDKFGKFLFMKCAVKLFMKKPDDWREHQSKQLKTKGMFANILDASQGPPKKKAKHMTSFTIDTKRDDSLLS